MNDQNSHHIIEPGDQLMHDCLYNLRRQLITLELHNFFEVATVAKLHEYVIPGICFNSLPHFDNILRLNGILILNFTHD